MSVQVLMSGPIRPSEQEVLKGIERIRSQFPNCRIFLSTWSGQLSDALRNAVDVSNEILEPSDSYIESIVHTKTQQQRLLGKQLDGWTYTIYKMIYGVQCVCELASSYVKDIDVVMRIRTDSIFHFQPEYLQYLLQYPNKYIAKRGDGFDWFAITTFAILRKVWSFPSIQDYNTTIENSWNAEAVIQCRVPIQVEYLDPKKVDMYIVRENGRKHYFP